MLDADSPVSQDTRERILIAAADIVAGDGIDALTTRAVSAAARCQPPTIYRIFGDKKGLLDAVAEHVFMNYAADTLGKPALMDPVEDLRSAWDGHIAFGLHHPAVYRLMVAGSSAGAASPAASKGMAALRGRVRRVAQAGLLRVSEERAVALIHAAGTGAITVLLEAGHDHDDLDLSHMAREAVMNAILSSTPPSQSSDRSQLAAALRTRVEDAPMLTPGERLMMDELLARMSDDI
ncbi:TetR/AcrR family transcriptional regulator [Sphingomonas sp. UYP23]